MRIVALLAVMLVSSCSGPDTWTDVPGANLEPQGRPGWDVAVREAALQWDEALASVGCPAPFTVNPSAGRGHPVKLVDEADWTSGDAVAGMTHDRWDTGLVDDWDDEWIEVRDRFPDRDPAGWAVPVLLHELGHAIGLDHREEGDSVMRQSVTTGDLQRVDVADAAAVLGCDAAMPDPGDPRRDYLVSVDCPERGGEVEFSVGPGGEVSGPGGVTGSVGCGDGDCRVDYEVTVDDGPWCRRTYRGSLVVGEDRASPLVTVAEVACADGGALLECSARVVEGATF